jgi:hypothetical protein
MKPPVVAQETIRMSDTTEEVLGYVQYNIHPDRNTGDRGQ